MMTELQVLICTIGVDGIRRVCHSDHPHVDGVEYIVAWQQPEEVIPVPNELERDDFRVLIHKSRGIAVNRNFAIDAASASIVVMSDDDVSFVAEELKNVIDVFRDRPDMDLATMRYHSSGFEKAYSSREFDLRKPEKGYFVSCIELVFRLSSIKGKIRFNEHFGFGTDFYGGEEGIFLHDALQAGLNCRYIPCYLCRHDGSSTGDRDGLKPAMIETKGVQFLIYFPFSWPLRMLVHAFRYAGEHISFTSYIRHWIRGVNKGRKLKMM